MGDIRRCDQRNANINGKPCTTTGCSGPLQSKWLEGPFSFNNKMCQNKVYKYILNQKSYTPESAVQQNTLNRVCLSLPTPHSKPLTSLSTCIKSPILPEIHYNPSPKPFSLHIISTTRITMKLSLLSILAAITFATATSIPGAEPLPAPIQQAPQRTCTRKLRFRPDQHGVCIDTRYTSCNGGTLYPDICASGATSFLCCIP